MDGINAKHGGLSERHTHTHIHICRCIYIRYWYDAHARTYTHAHTRTHTHSFILNVGLHSLRYSTLHDQWLHCVAVCSSVVQYVAVR